ncbi:MAG: Asp-tRNA(Asn)/Glu-tRNA(Gln) amidotransferase subunit GatA [Deltaproteobacteria bacterium]|nr:Asp-tRNA(Asn)/Glu-tRNA(Gln) amidotransferase subunit GatA [Deltaproteobacteria bacterium]
MTGAPHPGPGVADLATGVRAGELDPVELARTALDAADGLGTALGAFLTVDRLGAIEAARSIDRRRRAGDPLGLLAGVPVAVKDNILVRGCRCTCGSRMLERWVAPDDAAVVSALRAADAVLVGKTNLDEFAMGSSTEHSAFAVARNPWDPSRVAGGSSGGSAIAVASRIVPAALGSDTGGSVRLPAAYCGVYGLKPTYGRLSRRGLVAFASSLDQVGLFARSVEDLALLLAATAVYDPGDSTSLAQAAFTAEEFAALRGRPLRVGLVRSDLHIRTAGFSPRASAEPRPEGRGSVQTDQRLVAESADMADATTAAARRLAEAGCEVIEVEVPSPDQGVAAYYLIAAAEASANLARYDGVRYGLRRGGEGGIDDLWESTRREGFGPEVKRRIMLGTFALSAGYYDAYYDKAQRVRTVFRRQVEALLERVDALLLPTSPTTAFPLGERLDRPLSMYRADVYTVLANLTGGPALAFPAGLDGQGLPIGLQLVGRPMGEAVLLELARRHAEALGGELPAPPLHA